MTLPLPLWKCPCAPTVEMGFYNSIPSSLTLTATSLGWMFDSTGTLVARPHNLVRPSEINGSGTGWTFSASAYSSDTITAQDGSVLRAINDGATTNYHTAEPSNTNANNFTQGATYTITQKYAAKERDIVQLTFPVAAFGAGKFANFKLVGGGSVTRTAGVTASIQNLGGGIYLCSISAAATVTKSASAPITALINSETADWVAIYAGETKGVYVGAAQLNQGPAQPYYPTTSAPYYGPRFDHDPVTLQPRGLLIEEQRQNLLLNSAALSTQNVTVPAVAHTLSFYGTGSVDLSGTHTATVAGAGAFPTRKTYTFTPTAGTLTLTVTGTVQFAQLEIGVSESSYIPTYSAAVTRTAESLTTTNIPWFNAAQGSFMVQVMQVANPAASSHLVNFNDGSANNRIQAYISSTGGGIGGGATGGTAKDSATLAGVLVPYTSYKAAIGYISGNNRAAFKGTLAGAGAWQAANVPTDINKLSLGESNAGSAKINGWLQSFSYWNYRLSDERLQQVTQ